MGFDLTGIKPKNKTGEYFRNNVWWWHRLWRFTCMAASLPENIAGAGETNDGIKVKGKYHRAIVAALTAALKNKKKYVSYLKNEEKVLIQRKIALDKRFDKNYGQPRLKETPVECDYPFSWENVQEFLSFCKNNEGFEVW